MTSPPALEGVLGALAEAPLRPASAVLAWGRTVVVAPHPDDETLGCGGAIALLRDADRDVRVLVVSDGAASHPGSRKFLPPALRALPEEESWAALAILGVAVGDLTFLGSPDAAVPNVGAADFDRAVERCFASLAATRPATVLLPWRRDPHPDHRATAAIARAAVTRLDPAPRLVEYPVWAWARGEAGDAPAPGEVAPWRLDVGAALPRKLVALAAYPSQTTDLIDDTDGFRLTPRMLEYFSRPWELYLDEVMSAE